MIPSVTYSGVEIDQTMRFRSANCQAPAAKLVGLVFARPESKLAQSDLIPSLTYFHFRSGKQIAFYFGGYQITYDEVDFDHPESYTEIQGPHNQCWWFTAQSFNQFRREVELRTTWHYSGECDLILTNVRFDPATQSAKLDFTSAVCLQLDRLKEISSIPSVSNFFERIFEYAERQHPDDPASGFSDWVGLRLAKSTFRNFLLSWLPKAVQDEARGAFNLVTSDITA